MRLGLMAAAVAASLGGCVLDNPHNDVLVFGTTTKIALDVSAPVQNGAIPEFTLGYKRNEGVWMPLKANGGVEDSRLEEEQIKARFDACFKRRQDGAKRAQPIIGPRGERIPAPEFDSDLARRLCVNEVLPPDKYLAHSAGIDSKLGGTTEETDTYSVFASFGGRGSLGFSETAGALAQFFATGIAAQRLGANPGLAAALNADGEKPAEEAAKAEAEKAKAAQEQAKADAAMAAVAASRVQPQLETDAVAASNLAAKWTSCPDPAAADKTQYVAALAFAKGKAPSGIWDRLQKLEKRDEILQILQYTQSAREMNAFAEGIDEACKGT